MVTSVDDTADVSQSVINFQVDLSGINRKRPALTSYATTGLGSSVLIGLYVWQTWLIGVTQDRKLWAMSQTAPTVWQALSDATAATKLDGGLRPVFAEDGLRVVIVGGGAIQQWQGVGLSSRLGGGPAATHIAAIGARFVANNTSASQEFDWSNIGDGSHATWDALAFSNADARPDPVVGIFENLRELHVFGSSTDQIYSVGSDPLNPFDFVAATNVGLAAPYSVVRLDLSCRREDVCVRHGQEHTVRATVLLESVSAQYAAGLPRLLAGAQSSPHWEHDGGRRSLSSLFGVAG